MVQEDKSVYPISIAAELSKVHHRTLSLHERCALISLKKELQQGKQLVARLHLHLKEKNDPNFKISNIVAANQKGEKIKIKVKITSAGVPSLGGSRRKL